MTELDAQVSVADGISTPAKARKPNEKVVFYLPALSGGGAELVFVRVSNALVAQGVPVQMILNVHDGPFAKLLDRRVEVVELGQSVSLRAMPALIKHLRKERPRRIISAMTTLNLAAILAARLAGTGTKVVACERNTFSEVTRSSGTMRRLVLTLLVRILYPMADRVIGNTQGVADDITTVGRLRNPAQVIHNPAPDDDQIAPAKSAPAPHDWFTDGKGPVAVAMGRLVRQKDYRTMIEALAQARSDLRLIVLGEGPEKDALFDLAVKYGLGPRVFFAGFRMNRFDYLAHADLFLISSLVEGFPNALIEAVTMGVPVVATDFKGGGAEEILGRDIPMAIVPVRDATAFAKCIDAQLATPPSPEAFERIAARYHIETIADAFRNEMQR